MKLKAEPVVLMPEALLIATEEIADKTRTFETIRHQIWYIVGIVC
jgi:hypothetical protein